MNERRISPRVRNSAKLTFAEYGGEVPDDEAFETGTTRNVSASGISFFSRRKLEPKTCLVLRLGDEQDPIVVLAVVVHCQADSAATAEQFFVGCEFTKRLSSVPT